MSGNASALQVSATPRIRGARRVTGMTSTVWKTLRVPMPSSSVRPNTKQLSESSADSATQTRESIHNDNASRNVVAALWCDTFDRGGRFALRTSFPFKNIDTRVRLSDVSSAAYAFIDLPSGDIRGNVDHRRRRVVRRGALGPKSKFLCSRIRHASAKSRPVFAISIAMVQSALFTFLMPGICCAVKLGSARAATCRRTVRLPAVTQRAYVEQSLTLATSSFRKCRLFEFHSSSGQEVDNGSL